MANNMAVLCMKESRQSESRLVLSHANIFFFCFLYSKTSLYWLVITMWFVFHLFFIGYLPRQYCSCTNTFLDPSDSYFLFADLVGFYTHWTYMHIFRHIFLSNYWWQKSDIWSQASYRYPISWETFWTHQIPTSCLPILLIFIHI